MNKDDLIYELLGELAGVETWDVNLRDHPDAYKAVETFLAALAQQATGEPPKCATCNGHGMIGGPSFYNPGEGGEPCPDCAAPKAPSAYVESLITEAAQRYSQGYPVNFTLVSQEVVRAVATPQVAYSRRGR